MSKVLLLVFIIYSIISTYIINGQDKIIDIESKTNMVLLSAMSKYCFKAK
jgi:hypothetical protein